MLYLLLHLPYWSLATLLSVFTHTQLTCYNPIEQRNALSPSHINPRGHEQRSVLATIQTDGDIVTLSLSTSALYWDERSLQPLSHPLAWGAWGTAVDKPAAHLSAIVPRHLNAHSNKCLSLYTSERIGKVSSGGGGGCWWVGEFLSATWRPPKRFIVVRMISMILKRDNYRRHPAG